MAHISDKNINRSRNLMYGFTLIELLVVISIVSLLSSVVYANASAGRVKAQDAKKIVEARQVETAVHLFVADNGRAPLNYNVNNIAIEGTPEYEASMQELVDGGYLAQIPKTGDVETPYVYYNFGEGSAGGVLFATELKSVNAGSAGPSGSCLPFRTIVDQYSFNEQLQGSPEDEGKFVYSEGPDCFYGGIYPENHPGTTFEERMELWQESYNACWEQGGGGICGGDSESADYCVCVPY